MGKERLAAFSDGVIAIIITIMVLELKVPHGSDWTALMAVTKFRKLCSQLYIFWQSIGTITTTFCTPLREWTALSSGPTPSSCFGCR
jgi:uncharacterized membrane protein